MARELKVNLMAYDYSGYGASNGQATVLNTLADIEACYQWLLDTGKCPSDIALYGQSVGSGPSCHLAAKESGLAGVILHSPLATGARTDCLRVLPRCVV
jgi:dienelactone hydrolase